MNFGRRDPRRTEALGVRAYNERLILAGIRRLGPLSKAEISRTTGLSAQAASVIVNKLLKDGLLLKKAKVRGNVGQPFTPIALDPAGAYSIGVNVGRRNLEATLIDFTGAPIRKARLGFALPRPGEVMAEVRAWVSEWLNELGPEQTRRVVGIGLAAPGDLDAWAEELGYRGGDLAAWRDYDLAALLTEATGLPVTSYNDATAACAAEIYLNQSFNVRSAVYFYVGAFIGGGVVLDGRLYEGGRGNAGALGSMLLPGADGAPVQLLSLVSLVALEKALEAKGLPGRRFALEPVGAGDARAEAVWDLWADRASEAIALATANASSVVDFDAAIIDGVLHPERRRALTGMVAERIARLNRTGLSPIAIREGGVGDRARSLGAAILPLHGAFAPDERMIAGNPAAAASD